MKTYIYSRKFEGRIDTKNRKKNYYLRKQSLSEAFLNQIYKKLNWRCSQLLNSAIVRYCNQIKFTESLFCSIKFIVFYYFRYYLSPMQRYLLKSLILNIIKPLLLPNQIDRSMTSSADFIIIKRGYTLRYYFRTLTEI